MLLSCRYSTDRCWISTSAFRRLLSFLRTWKLKETVDHCINNLYLGHLLCSPLKWSVSITRRSLFEKCWASTSISASSLSFGMSRLQARTITYHIFLLSQPLESFQDERPKALEFTVHGTHMHASTAYLLQSVTQDSFHNSRLHLDSRLDLRLGYKWIFIHYCTCWYWKNWLYRHWWETNYLCYHYKTIHASCICGLISLKRFTNLTYVDSRSWRVATLHKWNLEWRRSNWIAGLEKKSSYKFLICLCQPTLVEW